MFLEVLRPTRLRFLMAKGRNKAKKKGTTNQAGTKTTTNQAGTETTTNQAETKTTTNQAEPSSPIKMSSTLLTFEEAAQKAAQEAAQEAAITATQTQIKALTPEGQKPSVLARLFGLLNDLSAVALKNDTSAVLIKEEIEKVQTDLLSQFKEIEEKQKTQETVMSNVFGDWTTQNEKAEEILENIEERVRSITERKPTVVPPESAKATRLEV